MATLKRFEELDAWQAARRLANDVYDETYREPLVKDFPLRDQIRRSAISAMANIAEGFERSGRREFIQFLAMAKGSVGELRSHLHLAHDRDYLPTDVYETLTRAAEATAQLIGGLMQYLRRTDVTGSKFRKP